MTAHGATPLQGARPAGAPSAPAVHELALSLGEIRQLFASMDPAPFHERDLDGQAADYIVERAREAPAGVPLKLVVHLGREAASESGQALLREAVFEYFGRCADGKRRELRKLFRTGRVSLIIGVAFLAAAIALAGLLGNLIDHEGTARLVRESLIIGGWVALWRPMEIFLYDGWPIQAEVGPFDRLAAMAVGLQCARPATEPAA
jgi:hypothetical protein